jgi:hypothetical protein
MDLESLVGGKQQTPITGLLMGVEGVGKSTFGADAPKPVFIDLERSTEDLDAVRFPEPDGGWKWEDVLDAIEELTTKDHEFKTLVVDTLDAAEPLLYAFICKRDKKKNIEDYGYGKGYTASMDEWRVFLARLERLRRTKGMNVILLAHTWIKTFKNPLGPDYDRYEMKLYPKSGALIREWVRVALFANFETYASKEKGELKAKGFGGNVRTVYTKRNAAWDAKDRLGLPDQFPLSWEEFHAHATGKRAVEKDALRTAIEEAVATLDDDKIRKWVDANVQENTDLASLAKVNNKLQSKLKEKEEASNADD